MGRLLIIAVVAATIGSLLGVLLGLGLLPVATPLAEHRTWFLGLCAALTATAVAVASTLVARQRAPVGVGIRRLLSAVLLGGLAGAFLAQQRYGYSPRGKQLLFFAGGAIMGAFLIGLVRVFRRKAIDEPRRNARGRWFQFTLGSLLAMAVVASAVLALWVRGPMKRRQVLAAIERSGGGRVRYASTAPDWVVDLLGDWVRGFFDEVEQITLFDTTDADVARLGVLSHLRSLTLSGDKVTDEAMTTVACLAQLEELQLGGTTMTKKGVEKLRHLRWLRSLAAPEAINDDVLMEISQLANLKTLLLVNNSGRLFLPSPFEPITRAGFDRLGKLEYDGCQRFRTSSFKQVANI